MNSCKQNEEPVTNEELKEIRKDILFSLNAYSCADLMKLKDFRDNEQVYSLLNLFDWCHSKGITGLDATGYFFPTYTEVPSDEYLENFKNKTAELGITLTGTAIRNNFASPDPKVHAEGVEMTKNGLLSHLGWVGDQPIAIGNGIKLSIGFSGFRGFNDLKIVEDAVQKVLENQ